MKKEIMEKGTSILSWGGAIFVLLITPLNSFAGYNIGAPTSGPFQQIGNWLQIWVDFMDGPFGMMVVVVSIIIAAVIWVAVPKSGALGVAARAVCAGLVILNVGTWVVSF